MKIILLSLILFTAACGPKSDTKKVVPHVDEMGNITGGTEKLRWNKEKFPLKIIVPCIQDTNDSLYPFMNCNQVVEGDRANYVIYPVGDSGDKVIESLTSAIQTWNSALGINAFEIEVSGTNKTYNDTPITYLSDSETTIKRLAFLSNWFSSMDASDPNKPGENVLAVTIYSYSQTTKRLLDADILFNLKKFMYITQPVESSYRNYCSLSYPGQAANCDADEKCSWSSGSCKEDAKFKGNMHFQSVLTHELGHFLGMEHVALVTDNASIMNPSLSSESIKVNLSPADKCRLNQRYRDIFTTCDDTTAVNKFCYDLTNVQSLGVTNGECMITECKSGYSLNSSKTACSIAQ